MFYNFTDPPLMLFGIYDVETILKGQGYYPFYVFFIACEIIGMLFSFTIEILAAHIMLSSLAFNKNLIRIFGHTILVHSISQFARLFLMLYQYGSLKIKKNFIADLPLLILSTFRAYMYISVVVLLVLIVLERVMATYYMGDYEKSERNWIKWFLSITALMLQITGTLLYIFFAARYATRLFLVMLPIVVFYLISCFLSFYVIYHLNANHLSLILRTYELRRYSLSLRFQLEENLRSLKLLRMIFAIHSLFTVVGCCIFVLPHIWYENGSPQLEFTVALLEAFQSIYGMFFVAFLLYLMPSWKRKFLNYFKRIFVNVNVDKVTDEHSFANTKREDETKIYFQQLMTSWQ